jgi:phage-related protein
MYRVRFYEGKGGKTPIEEFLSSTEKSTRSKIDRQIAHLQEFGLSRTNPALKKLTGTPLWEVRILGKNGVRIICVAVIDGEILVLHIFRKKSGKTNPKDLNISLKRYKEELDN